ncbi:Gfo/Idh/MocA family oxidoreductase [Devosia sp. MC532]|uniref:Gfo/Idh/MocA family protein n=1 Tax=Devosia sp. MC532 TaxID=2799788 RepID=UPI0018F4433F|nr:Gfo/Idh/MocA family oxidoreductase [Devosia sp. MC532]MBJ7577820.1 Gfo/Idh/MocA family oxidoreductase [Devosia sp. MC532]
MRYRAILAGCGAMSKGWLRAIADTPYLSENVEIVGLVDLNLAAAQERAEEFSLAVPVGSDLAAMLDQLNPDIVFDVVIPQARQSLVVTALNHGCHVLSEKPMAQSLSDAQGLLALSTDTRLVHAIIQNRRFNMGIRRLKRFIDDGHLGEITAIHADFFVGAHFGGFREAMDNVLLLDMAIHTFDAARFLAGSKPTAVYCHETNPKGSWYRHGAAANAIFEFENDLTFTYRGSWSAEGANTSWESGWRIIGTKGTVLWDGYEKFEANIVSGTDGFFRPLKPVEVPAPAFVEQTNGHASVLSDFVGALRADTRPETDNHDNINSLAMVLSAIESARTQSRVRIDPGA